MAKDTAQERKKGRQKTQYGVKEDDGYEKPKSSEQAHCMTSVTPVKKNRTGQDPAANKGMTLRAGKTTGRKVKLERKKGTVVVERGGCSAAWGKKKGPHR